MPPLDRDITIPPFKYPDEMRNLRRNVMSGTNPQILNLCAKHTYIDFMSHSGMLLRSVNKRLIPELNKYVDWAKMKRNCSFDVDMLQPETWIEFDIQEVVHSIISRMSAKVSVCRDQG